jgi:endonuclease VIII-like 1
MHILFRAGIPPFVSARSVLEPLVDEESESANKVKVKSESPDVLQLCHVLPMEVINLGKSSRHVSERRILPVELSHQSR